MDDIRYVYGYSKHDRRCKGKPTLVASVPAENVKGVLLYCEWNGYHHVAVLDHTLPVARVGK